LPSYLLLLNLRAVRLSLKSCPRESVILVVNQIFAKGQATSETILVAGAPMHEPAQAIREEHINLLRLDERQTSPLSIGRVKRHLPGAIGARPAISRFPVSPRSFIPISDPPPRQVIGRHFDLDAVAGENADKVFAHLAADLRQHDMLAVIQTNAKEGVGQFINHDALSRDQIIFSQTDSPLVKSSALALPENARRRRFERSRRTSFAENALAICRCKLMPKSLSNYLKDTAAQLNRRACQPQDSRTTVNAREQGFKGTYYARRGGKRQKPLTEHNYPPPARQAMSAKAE